MMWMVENDDERRLKMGITDHPLLHGRKLRPLMPRPMVMRSSKEEMTMMPCSCCIKNPNLLHLHHAQYNHGHQEKAAVAAVSTTPRWNPTPEQLQALEEMYRRGVRTPSAEQIQQIASKLTRFGKIQGKNVFYWFQNHKARERQKKRRHLIIQSQSQSKSQSQNNIISLIPHTNNTSQSAAGAGAGAGAGVSSRRSHMEIEDHHKLATPSPCHQGSASMQAGAVIRPDHFRQDEWTQLQLLHHNEKELELHKLKKMNNIPSAENIEEAELQTSSNHHLLSSAPPDHDHNQTLHLFPIVAATTSLHPVPHHPIPAPSTIQTNFTPNHFIEFLPTKK